MLNRNSLTHHSQNRLPCSRRKPMGNAGRSPALLALVGLALGACGAEIGERSAAIIAGDLATPNEMGQVQVSSAGGRCTGTLLNNRLVQTARHCVPDDAASITVYYGTQQKTVSRVVRHPRAYDVTLLKLASPMTINGRTVGFDIPLSDMNAAALAGKTVTCLGYGNQWLDPAGVPGCTKAGTADGLLHKAQLTVHHIETGIDGQTNAIYYPNDRGQLTSFGDSGGGCFYPRGGTGELRLVSSNSWGYCNGSAAGAMTVDQFLLWAMEDNSQWDFWGTNANMKVLAGDFNGDGKTDVMKFDVADSGWFGDTGLYVGLSTGSRFSTTQWDFWGTNANMKVLAGDFNGDGKTDVMKFDVADSGWFGDTGLYVGLSTGSRFSTTQWDFWGTNANMKVLAGDFNGDGKTDVMKFDVADSGRFGDAGLYVGLSTGSRFSTTRWDWWSTSANMKVLAGDFNGDGKTDVLKLDVKDDGTDGAQGIYVGISDGTRFNTSLWLSGLVVNAKTKLVAGDFNGDGKTDIAVIPVDASGAFTTHTIYVGLSTGSTFSMRTFATWSTNENMKVAVADFNGDGMADLAKLDVDDTGTLMAKGLYVNISTGYSFRDFPHGLWSTNAAMHTLVGDFNGDGKGELMKFDVDDGGGFNDRGLWVGLSR